MQVKRLLHLESACHYEPITVAIIGTGDFGRAFGQRLEQRAHSKYHIIYGSRRKAVQTATDLETGIGNHNICSIEDAIGKSDLVLLAVPSPIHTQLPLDKLQPGQVVIDCSNSPSVRNGGELSNAERLAANVPSGVVVIKAFNVLSAYTLNQDEECCKSVPICGNDGPAKEVVMELARNVGLAPADRGDLKASREIERIPHRRFDVWHRPLIVSTILWIFFLTMNILRSFCQDSTLTLEWDSKTASQILKYVNKACDNHALGMLSLCYLPGVTAAYIQLYRGTKYSKFPAWLDQWLKMRKQLGLLMLLSASVHGCVYMLTYKPHFIKETIVDNSNKTHTVVKDFESLDLKTNAYLLAGVIALASAAILGITSLPSVAASLSWREFRLIQSRLGWFCLSMATTHCVLEGWNKIATFECVIIPASNQLPLYLPALTVIPKLPLRIPFIDRRLTLIRAGMDHK